MVIEGRCIRGNTLKENFKKLIDEKTGRLRTIKIFIAIL